MYDSCINNSFPFQYNLRTQIYSRHRYNLFEVDSPEWDDYPRNTSFREEDPLDVRCLAFISNELNQSETNKYNEIAMVK